MTLRNKNATFSRAESLAFCGLSIALLTVSAWITIPLGPVPFTLQTMMLVFVVLLFPPREALTSVFGYLVLGALGVPVFSGMKGGMATLLGSTGGFILGFGLGTIAAVLILKVWKAPTAASADDARSSKTQHAKGAVREYVAAFVLLVISYICGWIQLILVADMTPLAAFLAGIAPFIVIDIVKVFVGASLARAIRHAVPALSTHTV